MRKEYFMIVSDMKNSVLSIGSGPVYDTLELARKDLKDYEDSQKGFKGDYKIEVKFKTVDEVKVQEEKKNKSFGEFA